MAKQKTKTKQIRRSYKFYLNHFLFSFLLMFMFMFVYTLTLTNVTFNNPLSFINLWIYLGIFFVVPYFISFIFDGNLLIFIISIFLSTFLHHLFLLGYNYWLMIIFSSLSFTLMGILSLAITDLILKNKTK